MPTRINISDYALYSLFILLLSACAPGEKVPLVPEGYASWQSPHTGYLEYSIGGHTAPVRRIFTNEIAASQKQELGAEGHFPDGSIFVKESYATLPVSDEKPLGLTVMIKDSENPDAVGGWIWLAVDGEGNEQLVTGKFCIGCHQAANTVHNYGDKNADGEFRDFIFFPPFAKLQKQ